MFGDMQLIIVPRVTNSCTRISTCQQNLKQIKQILGVFEIRAIIFNQNALEKDQRYLSNQAHNVASNDELPIILADLQDEGEEVEEQVG